MHVRNKLPLMYIINEVAEKDEKNNTFSLKYTHVKWIICYTNYLSSVKYDNYIFDINLLKELTQDEIDAILNEMIKSPLDSKTTFESMPVEVIKTLKKAIKEYKYNQKSWLETKEQWSRFISSIKSWLNK